MQALKNGQVDGIVVDLPTAFYMTAAQLDDGVIVGQLPPGTGTPDQFGLVLAKGSPLTGCVSQAVDALRADGTLDELEQEQWLRRRRTARPTSCPEPRSPSRRAARATAAVGPDWQPSALRAGAGGAIAAGSRPGRRSSRSSARWSWSRR